jgi:effector-binding domain-containing protein/catechol 2,3-dioxygenase-like lactoylglutathione lyase family enzyme
MLTLPKIVDRGEQPCVGIVAKVTMRDIGPTARSLLPEVYGWLAKRGIAPAGPPFFKYNVIDMARELEIEFGVPTRDLVEGDARVQAGRLPAGRFAALVFRGPYEELYAANGVLIDWAKGRGIRWDSEQTASGERFGCRLEIYRTDPAEEPDPSKRETEVAIRIADAAVLAETKGGTAMLAGRDAMATIAVKDLAAARAFYEGKLKLERIGPESSEALIYASGDSRIVVYRSQYAGTNQATAATWAVGDQLAAVVSALKAAGIAFEHYDLPGGQRDGDIHSFGDFKAAWFKDPDGNILHVNNGGEAGGM